MEPKITIIGGIPGTGKTTIANELAKEIGAVLYTKDLLEAVIVHSGVAAVVGLKSTLQLILDSGCESRQLITYRPLHQLRGCQ